ncbi:MAG: SH3 domain-containing protein [Clostridia bacterium]|nr:SH3 domain-containing protein [Clostridia bacterium]
MRRGMIAAVLAAALLLLSLAAALAEPARVMTPGGPVKMRKTADDKGRLVVSVPNHAVVEVTEAGEEWCAVTYKKKSGYIRTEFLRMPSQLPGRTVYPDEGTLFLYAEASEDAPIVAAAPCSQAVRVLAAEDGWVRAELNGVTGWAKADRFTWQKEEAPGAPDWMTQRGMLVETVADVGMRGDPVTVACTQKAQVLALGEDGFWHWIPQASVALSGFVGIADGGEEEPAAPAHSVTWPKAEEAARAALTKKIRAYAKEDSLIPMTVLADRAETGGEVWECGFFSPGGQYRYAALVDAETGKVLLTADYTGFAEPLRPGALLDPGEVKLTLSADVLAVGEVLDCSVIAWSDHLCAWSLEKDGREIAATEKPGAHFTAAWRAREAGEYTLTVTVTDEEGIVGSVSAVFTVDGTLPAAEGTGGIYSQKDGWWADKAYRDRSLETSGCAIFALSHALHLRGHFGPETEPAALAKKHALCLTPTGTNNERLIREAGKTYGFSTQGELISDRKDIVRRLRAGELFSFSIARGHIALICGVSTDGTMVQVIDSAPSATYERIQGSALYYEAGGRWIPALTPDDIPGARWFFETDSYGGMTYWMELGYAARRGVRMIGVEKTEESAEAE